MQLQVVLAQDANELTFIVLDQFCLELVQFYLRNYFVNDVEQKGLELSEVFIFQILEAVQEDEIGEGVLQVARIELLDANQVLPYFFFFQILILNFLKN